MMVIPDAAVWLTVWLEMCGGEALLVRDADV
jgi:uncharacterized membrane protein